MLTLPIKVNSLGIPAKPAPHAALAARVIIITELWLQGACGVTTGAKAAAIAGCSLPLIDAARVVLQSNDKALLAQVLGGQISLTTAASKMRRRVRLFESFKAASLDDIDALVQAVEGEEVSDTRLASAVA